MILNTTPAIAVQHHFRAVEKPACVLVPFSAVILEMHNSTMAKNKPVVTSAPDPHRTHDGYSDGRKPFLKNKNAREYNGAPHSTMHAANIVHAVLFDALEA